MVVLESVITEAKIDQQAAYDEFYSRFEGSSTLMRKAVLIGDGLADVIERDGNELEPQTLAKFYGMMAFGKLWLYSAQPDSKSRGHLLPEGEIYCEKAIDLYKDFEAKKMPLGRFGYKWADHVKWEGIVLERLKEYQAII